MTRGLAKSCNPSPQVALLVEIAFITLISRLAELKFIVCFWATSRFVLGGAFSCFVLSDLC